MAQLGRGKEPIALPELGRMLGEVEPHGGPLRIPGWNDRKGTVMGRERDEYFWFGQGWAAPADDGEIRTLLLDQLREDPFTRTESISVAVADAVVTLEGTVTSSLARRAADDDAWATPGVRDVNNHIRVVIVRAADPDGPRAA